jgi:hypothetical protein
MFLYLLSASPNSSEFFFCIYFVLFRKSGVDQLLESKYKGYIITPESGYDATLQIDCSAWTGKPDNAKRAFAHEVALLKRHALSAPFVKVKQNKNRQFLILFYIRPLMILNKRNLPDLLLNSDIEMRKQSTLNLNLTELLSSLVFNSK